MEGAEVRGCGSALSEARALCTTPLLPRPDPMGPWVLPPRTGPTERQDRRDPGLASSSLSSPLCRKGLGALPPPAPGLTATRLQRSEVPDAFKTSFRFWTK